MTTDIRKADPTLWKVAKDFSLQAREIMAARVRLTTAQGGIVNAASRGELVNPDKVLEQWGVKGYITGKLESFQYSYNLLHELGTITAEQKHQLLSLHYDLLADGGSDHLIYRHYPVSETQFNQLNTIADQTAREVMEIFIPAATLDYIAELENAERLQLQREQSAERAFNSKTTAGRGMMITYLTKSGGLDSADAANWVKLDPAKAKRLCVKIYLHKFVMAEELTNDQRVEMVTTENQRRKDERAKHGNHVPFMGATIYDLMVIPSEVIDRFMEELNAE